MKNDIIKSDWKKYTITQKISFVLVVLIFALLILGSVGGLVYLLKPKKVNAEEIIGGGVNETSSATVVVSLPIIYYLPGAYTSYPGDPVSPGLTTFVYPLIFSSSYSNSSDSVTLSLSSFSMVSRGYISFVLDTSVGVGTLVSFWSATTSDNLLFYLECTDSNLLTSEFATLYSVLCTYVAGSNEPVVFEITDINGSYLKYELTPYRYEEFSAYELNPTLGFSGRWLYIADSDVNFTERLNQAKEESYNNGYNQGYTAGKDYGYNVGYNQGVNDTDKFTFSSLLNAIFYAPLKAFISIFNFEILGVNVLNIISFLFTMLIAIGIIRWVV